MERMEAGEKVRYNHLIKEKSPYLLQHAENPVDWYPWGDEAFQKARKEDKPIFLSIGYATCHWCHVMRHESFEDKEVARLLNESYISIKVDREERPDVDQIYMRACQVMAGRGVWPLSVFMTPEGKPFLAGSYFPRTTKMGLPGFVEILKHIAALWQNDREQITRISEDITDVIRYRERLSTSGSELGLKTLRLGYKQLVKNFDKRWGGFSDEPKFPIPHNLTFLLRWHKRSNDRKARDMVETTLNAMRNGGIFDQIGFGFHRYSVDEKWLVPHFEKMLYDQAMLAMAYVEAYQVTAKPRYAQVAREIFTYVLREMTSSDGGFYSAEDADSEGKEGLFYLWTPKEVKRHLGKDVGDLICRFYDISADGNFRDRLSIPHISVPPEVFAEREGMDVKELCTLLEQSRKRLFEVREKRPHPLRDDQILTSWNGLMIAALAKGYQALGDPAYTKATCQAADFILHRLRMASGRLLRRYRHGDIAYQGYLEDYSFLVWGLIELYEATFEIRYLEEAVEINKIMIDLFWDDQDGGLYFAGKENEKLIARSKDAYDGRIPSGNSVSALNFIRLGRMTGNTDLEKKADQLLSVFSRPIEKHPIGYTQFLIALDFAVGPSLEILISGDPTNEATQEMISVVQKNFLPNKVLLFRPKGVEGKRLSAVSPFVADLRPINNEPTVYICEHYACKNPITDVNELSLTIQPIVSDYPMLIGSVIVGELEVFCYLIGCRDTKEGIIIDPGGDEQKILAKIKEMDLHIKYIVNTHGHPDHTSANKKIKQATGALTVVHELDAEFFQTERVRELSSKIGCTPTEIEADVLAHDGDILKVGNLELKLIHTPGHSPGGMCVYVDGNLFTGDTLFVGDVGRTDLPGASLDKLLNSLETKILPLPDDTIIWPGHDYGDTPTSAIGHEKKTNPYITDFILG